MKGGNGISEEDLSFFLLRALLGVFFLLLVGVTYPLWFVTPLAATSPQIPWFPFLTGLPGLRDPFMTGITAYGALLFIKGAGGHESRLEERVSIGCFTIGLSLLVLLDQHRLQPWVTQFLIFGFFLMVARGSEFLRGWRWIVASIYIWSAISKCDATFLTHQGQLFLNGLLDPLGVNRVFWTPEFNQRLAMLFPAGELLTGVLLLIPQTRRWGLWVSIALHAVLIWILAFGLKHEWAVLVWNLFFILQNLIIYKTTPIPETELAPKVTVFAMVAVFYPALELFGYCDHWPAWGVYCARPAQVRFYIEESAKESVPEHLKKFLGSPAPLDERYPLSLDAWSFATRYCPIYPQERYRLALGLAMLKGSVPDEAVTVEIRSTPNRWTGERQSTQLEGITALEKACNQFLLNTERR
ncbi:MAG TPA: MauE/DoxX family redox-associated membrane protein [Planctomicrobium sp.]|nr:MauE/DoxX family redox-associated membrane protein [Planctomicrobium sp.]